MQRSSSMTRVADDYYKNLLSSSSPATGDGNSGNNLPVYNQRKDKSRLRSAENAVHLIPLVLLLCAIILWFFSSNPVDVVNKRHGGIIDNMEGLKGARGTDIDGTQSNLMPHVELEDVDLLHHHLHHHRQAMEKKPSV